MTAHTDSFDCFAVVAPGLESLALAEAVALGLPARIEEGGGGLTWRGDLRSVFTSSDYPREAQMRRQQGNGRYLLLVDEQGKIAGCDVLTPTGIPILDAMACVVLQSRAKFSPALDLSGRPIRSALTTPPISWRLEP